MTPVKAPCTSFVLPDVCEPTVNDLTRYETGTGCVRARNYSLVPHNDGKIAVNAEELDITLERGEVNDSPAHEGISILLS